MKKTIGIIGLGYVGLPLLINFSKKFNVLGFDSSKNKTELLNKGSSYIDHISHDEISSISNNFDYIATSDFSLISQVDAIIICVPTPITKHREPDLTFVNNVMDSILPYIKENQIISLESTTYPGTTDELIATRVSDSGFDIGTNFYVVYSPEREDPGSGFPLSDIPKVLGGVTQKCTDEGTKIYSEIFKEVVPVSSVKVAELSKLLENIHRAVNLGMINEFKVICDRMEVDPFEVIKASSTKPFGFVPYYPGPGWGGHCIPVDPFYFSWKAKEFGINSRFIELAGELNSETKEFVLNKISHALNSHSKSIKGSNILILGISYKPNVDDARESPSLDIFSSLLDKGANVEFSDPFFQSFPKTRKYQYNKHSLELSEENIKAFDIVVLLTNHSQYDYELIKDNAQIIVDARGVYEINNKNIFRA
jgi:UDP-N-acetyl-D-glucosamine dehydrogenase